MDSMTLNFNFLRDIKNYILVNELNTYSQLLKSTDANTSTVQIYGVYFLYSKSPDCITSLITDGDIRRGLTKGLTLNSELREFVQHNFISINFNDLSQCNLTAIHSKLSDSFNLSKLDELPRYVPLKLKGQLSYVIDTHLIGDINYFNNTESIGIFGLGYVGVTLAAYIASKGIRVTGYDINQDIIKNLSDNKLHVKEPLLHELTSRAFESELLSYKHVDNIEHHSSYVICVGTAMIQDKLDDSQINAVINNIINVVSSGDQIYLRSTVPMGFSRKIYDLIMNKLKLKWGKTLNVHLSFTPERTIEGNALNELSSIPQIIGSIDKHSQDKATIFWSKLSNSIVECDSLEEAEAVKLVSNSYRDLMFGFSNMVSFACEDFNINAHRLIARANEGYPRNQIPYPSPGVGGYCLTKDPLMLQQVFQGKKNFHLLSLSRNINDLASNIPIQVLSKWNPSKAKSTYNILIIGLAFKGNPETTDIRLTPSRPFIDYLKTSDHRFKIFDFAIASHYNSSNFPRGYLDNYIDHLIVTKPNGENLNEYDCIFFLNNNLNNISLNLSSFLKSSSLNSKLIFDGWCQFDHLSNYKTPCFTYATLGYIAGEKY